MKRETLKINCFISDGINPKIFCKKFFTYLLIITCFLSLFYNFSEAAETEEETIAEVKRIYDLADKLDDIEKQNNYKKMLRPEQDVDFLYECVIGTEERDFSKYYWSLPFVLLKWYLWPLDWFDKPKLKSHGFKVNTKGCRYSLIDCNRTFIEKEPLYLYMTHDNNATNCSDNNATIIKNMDQVPLQCKLEAIEQTLYDNNASYYNSVSYDNNASLRDRISEAYNEINNEDWYKDNMRFGIMAGNAARLKTFSTGIALHAYPSYRRHTPGKFNRENIIRRLSFVFSVGAMSKIEDDSGKETTNDPVFFFGLGFDITRGFTLNVGESLYFVEEENGNSKKLGESITFGVTLTSDLWRNLVKSIE